MKHRCKACGQKFLITQYNVRKEWIERGYDGDYNAYIVECPHCGEDEEISFLKLPFRIAVKLLFNK